MIEIRNKLKCINSKNSDNNGFREVVINGILKRKDKILHCNID